LLLSVLIPCYNNDAALQQCLRSFHDGSGHSHEVEFVVVDDGSLPALKQPPYDDVRLLRQQHGGASAARNAAIAVARGRCV